MDIARVCIDQHGHGSVFYPSGRLAITISPVNDHQARFLQYPTLSPNCFYAFDDDSKSTMLLGIDEHVCGFISSSPHMKKDNMTYIEVICLTPSGGIHGVNGRIVEQWHWETKSKKTHTKRKDSPDDIVTYPSIILNDYMNLDIQNQSTITLSFRCGLVKHICNVGLHLKRTTTYLDDASRTLDGNLILSSTFTRKSLQQRQRELSESLSAQRNKIRPKSENLTGLVSDIVAKLERSFDNLGYTFSSTSFLTSSWKSLAFQQTIDELPAIKSTGTESGILPGLGKYIYQSSQDEKKMSQTQSRLFTLSGTWKTDLDVRKTLYEENPPLKRSQILVANSGRYTDTLIVDRKAITPTNPTGMTTLPGIPLSETSWKEFKLYVGYRNNHNFKKSLPTAKLDNSTIIRSSNAGFGRIDAVLVIRKGDVLSSYFERASAVVNEWIEKNKNGEGKQFTLQVIDASVNNDIISELDIKALPVFIMFQGSKLVYSGPIQGHKLPTLTPPCPVLVIGSEVLHQSELSKTLKKSGCDVYFCDTLREALDRIVRVMTHTPPQALLIANNVLRDEGSGGKGVYIISKLQGFSKTSNPIPIISLVPRRHSPVESTTNYPKLEVPLRLNEVTNMLTNLSLRGVHSLEMKPQGRNIGMSPNVLLSKLREVHSGIGVPYHPSGEHSKVGIRLSTEDLLLR